MKRVKIMFSAVLAMAILASALAFKAKKLNCFCMYKTTLNAEEELTCAKVPVAGICTTPIINGGVTASSVFTTKTHCAIIPSFTNPLNCTLTLTTIFE